MALQTATNPDTGETVVLVGDKWEKAEQTASNEKGEKAFLVGGNWVTDSGPFQSTEGGAAVGNPSLKAQGENAVGMIANDDPLKAIGRSALSGGLIGAGAAELVGGAGRIVGALPRGAAAGRALERTGDALRNAGRVAPAVAGAQAGAISEFAGQAVELAGAPWQAAEAARLIAGGTGPELTKAAAWVVRNKGGIPMLYEHLKKTFGNEVKLTEEQRKFIENRVAQIQGGGTTADLEGVGSLMGAEGRRLMSDSDRKLADALIGQAQVEGIEGTTMSPNSLSGIGERIRAIVVPKFKVLDDAQANAYKATKVVRDKLVSDLEGNGRFVSQTPEFKKLVSELTAELDNSQGMKNTPAVQAAYQKILNSLVSKEKDVSGQSVPTRFTALDQERRQLGDAFAGKPDEGYAAMGSARAKELYKKIRDIQVQYAGGKGGAHDKLLSDYAADIPGLEQASSKIGKKVTGLDQYREGVYATDAKEIPKAFFKSTQSFKDLVELTGSAKEANAAALAFADRELAGKGAADVRKWMGEMEWMPNAPAVRKLVDNYASRLEAAERSVNSATDYAKRIAADTTGLLANKIPAQKATDLIEAGLSGKMQLFDMIGPVVSKSPAMQAQMMNAARKVVAERVTGASSAKETAKLFDQNLRPMLEKMGAGDPMTLDFVGKRLKEIAAMAIPEVQRLGMSKRILLQGMAGWTASIEGRIAAKRDGREPITAHGVPIAHTIVMIPQ